jgi:hypothetical protein
MDQGSRCNQMSLKQKTDAWLRIKKKRKERSKVTER